MMKNKFSLLPEIFNEGNKIINTVNFVSRLYLTKNLVILVLSIIPWFLDVIYPLTPRTSSLISLLGVGLPAYFIAVKNGNTRPVKHFYTDLMSYTLISSVIILFFAYLSLYITTHLLNLPQEPSSAIMFAVLIILYISNFVTTVIFEDRGNALSYSLFAIVLFVVFFLTSFFEIDHFIFFVVTTFYEITVISLEHYVVIFALVIPGTLLLFAAQFLRYRLSSRLRS